MDLDLELVLELDYIRNLDLDRKYTTEQIKKKL